MLVLFNTAYRPGYARNILRTIFLPIGATNEFRYSIGEELQISDSLVAEVEAKGQPDVLICFGDRFSEGGYTFYPVRKGKLLGLERSGGRVYFTVRLQRHVAAVEPGAFTEKLYEMGSSKTGNDRLLCLTNDDPEFSKDGRYVFWSETGLDTFLEQGERAWRAASGQLANAKSFSSTDKRHYIFSKCDLIVDGNRKNYVARDHTAQYEVPRGSDLRLRVQYYYPAQNDDKTALAKLSIVSSDAIQVLSSNEQALDTPESRLEFPFAIEPGSDKRFASVDLAFSSSATDVEVIGAHDAIPVRIYQPVWWWLLVIGVVVLYIVGAAFSAADEKIVGEVLKTLAVVAMVLGLGKKLV